MSLGRRTVLMWATLALGALALFAPVPAHAHAGHEHIATAKKATLQAVVPKGPAAEQILLRHLRAVAVEKTPTKLGAPLCDGMCCLGVGLSCCSSAMTVEVDSVPPPVWRHLSREVPPDRYGHSAEFPDLPKPPRFFV